MFQDRAQAAAPDLYAYKTADETVSASTTMQADDHLTVSVKASRKYIFRIVLFVATDANFKCDFDASTCTVTNLIWSLGVYDDIQSSAHKSTLAADAFEGEAWGSNKTYIINGAVEPATDGTFALRWAQNVAIDSTVVKRGSSMSVWRLA